MSKKRPTKAERKHLSAVAGLGCCVCNDLGFYDTPAEVHHLDRDRDHYRSRPLCPHHHRNGCCGEAVHQGRKSWESNFGTEEYFLERVNEHLGVVT